MENQTRFDLNTAIANWQQELAAQSNLTSEVRRELETHLRDSIAELRQRGLNDEESFWLARRRVGQPKQLGEEFAKANPDKAWRERVFWMTVAIVGTGVWGATINPLIMNLVGSYSYLIPPQFILIAAHAFSLLLFVLPVLGLMIWLARGQMNRSTFILASILKSRTRLAVSVILLVIFTGALSTALALFLSKVRGIHLMPVDITQQWIGALLNVIRPLFFVALLVWLMPTQNKKTSTQIK